ncbi:hemerythrin domain-containing protein [Archangium violaceum]|uniref:hemerythrin domain-containing protein n=1 Tax=Archangium violaceum TaxID=83451 RepID=UPI00194F2FBB|nr:hemerythrin domain-containing protein [Archangium violaceum]QRN94758.1 hemerythrin domain-containing protein [Archangium violaceum]
MDAIDILMNEHRHIERVLDVLERAVVHGRGGGDVSPVLFERAAHFLLTFVDGSHDAKEGEVFQAITSRGLPLGEGVMAALSGQHAMGRELAEELRETARAVTRGEKEPEDIYVLAERYVRLERGHTEAEEGRFFPIVRRLLPVDMMERVRAKFARIEAAHGPLADAADALELAFPLPATPVRRMGGGRPQPWGGR